MVGPLVVVVPGSGVVVVIDSVVVVVGGGVTVQARIQPDRVVDPSLTKRIVIRFPEDDSKGGMSVPQNFPNEFVGPGTPSNAST